MWFFRVVWIAILAYQQGKTRPRPSCRGAHRRSSRYRKRREQVKVFWIVAGLVVLLEPMLHFAVSVSLFTTFLSFMYLDEAGFQDDRGQ
ncbi:hypothetical protein [Ketobacter sp.]